MSGFRIVAGTDPALWFERPRAVLRAAARAGIAELLSRAERALDAGAWIAGYLEYDGPSALGVFDAPRDAALPDPAQPPLHTPPLLDVDFESYAAAIARLQRAIYEGDVYEVNYTVAAALGVAGDPLALYAYYARRTGAPYQAYVDDGDRALLSWSPELFLAFDGDRVTTKPMKGTAPPDRAHELRDAKNRAEHVMIVDLLRNDLHRVADEVDVARLFEVERYPTYATMTSTIEARLRAGTPLAAVFEAAFPCGSVTGAPKVAAMRFIGETEAAPRGAYCGAIGFLSPQRRGWWNVAIRTAQIDRASGFGRYDAGGAIVADSDARGEWDEIAVKTRFLRGASSGFSLLETFASDADDASIGAHLQRMERSARAFGVAFDGEQAMAAARDGAGRNGDAVLVRLRLSADGTFLRDTAPLERPRAPVRVCLSPQVVSARNPLLAHKTSWRVPYDAALSHALARECFEALLRNERGEITEGSRTNVFAEIGGALVTPPLSCGVLPGILRERIVSEGRAVERALTLDDLRGASAVYVGNSARGLLRAHLMDDDERGT